MPGLGFGLFSWLFNASRLTLWHVPLFGNVHRSDKHDLLFPIYPGFTGRVLMSKLRKYPKCNRLQLNIDMSISPLAGVFRRFQRFRQGNRPAPLN